MCVERKLKELIVLCRGNIPIDKIMPDSDLVFDFGFESLSFMQLIVEIEEEFKISIEGDDLLIEKISVFDDLMTLIKKYVESKIYCEV